jgi:hypothetical protein
MAERFLRGWKVLPDRLLALVGSSRFTARHVLKSRANAKCLEDVLMTLGDGDDVEGQRIAEGALGEMLEGKLRPNHAYEYARVLELLLNHTALPLATDYKRGLREPQDQIWMQLTYSVPNDTFGRWNPLLKALGLPTLAKQWCSPNLGFPWKKGKLMSGVDWPAWTVWDAKTLTFLSAEIERLDKKHVSDLKGGLLSDDGQYVKETRAELWAGLTRLRSWIQRARGAEKREGEAWGKEGNALFLVMDGDQ